MLAAAPRCRLGCLPAGCPTGGPPRAGPPRRRGAQRVTSPLSLEVRLGLGHASQLGLRPRRPLRPPVRSTRRSRQVQQHGVRGVPQQRAAPPGVRQDAVVGVVEAVVVLGGQRGAAARRGRRAGARGRGARQELRRGARPQARALPRKLVEVPARHRQLPHRADGPRVPGPARALRRHRQGGRAHGPARHGVRVRRRPHRAGVPRRGRAAARAPVHAQPGRLQARHPQGPVRRPGGRHRGPRSPLAGVPHARAAGDAAAADGQAVRRHDPGHRRGLRLQGPQAPRRQGGGAGRLRQRDPQVVPGVDRPRGAGRAAGLPGRRAAPRHAAPHRRRQHLLHERGRLGAQAAAVEALPDADLARLHRRAQRHHHHHVAVHRARAGRAAGAGRGQAGRAGRRRVAAAARAGRPRRAHRAHPGHRPVPRRHRHDLGRAGLRAVPAGAPPRRAGDAAPRGGRRAGPGRRGDGGRPGGHALPARRAQGGAAHVPRGHRQRPHTDRGHRRGRLPHPQGHADHLPALRGQQPGALLRVGRHLPAGPLAARRRWRPRLPRAPVRLAALRLRPPHVHRPPLRGARAAHRHRQDGAELPARVQPRPAAVPRPPHVHASRPAQAHLPRPLTRTWTVTFFH